jgi:acyl CoA:acetate/3-ketoacid CoA transferase
MPSKQLTFDAAARLVPDGAVVSIGSSAGLNCPDRMLQAIGERFAREGAPGRLTLLLPIAAGDLYGLKGIDHLAQRGLIDTVIAGSYPSGPSSLPSPKIWELIGANEVAAYNVPSGLLYDMHRDVAGRRAGVFTRVGLDTFVDPRRQGCKMNDAAARRGEIVRLVTLEGTEWLHFPNIPPTVAIVRGTTADERGNVSMEHEGAVLGTVDLALAARNSGGLVIAQVERVTAAGTIPTQRVHLPSTLVDVVVVDPEQRQATEIDYDPTISGETQRPLSSFEPPPWSVDVVIARRAAMELATGDAVNLGFGISALVPAILIHEGQAGAVTWVIEQGAIGGVPVTGFAFGCAANAEAIVPSPQQFTYFQGGGFDCSLLSFMEIDAAGNVNVSRLSARPYLTAGVGGFADITAHAKRLVFSGYFRTGGIALDAGEGRLTIQKDGKIAKLVREVEHVTFSGRRAVEMGQDVTYVTERCVMKLTAAGPTIVEVAPGVDLQRDVLAQAAFPLQVAAGVATMDARLFWPAPVGLRLRTRERRWRVDAVEAGQTGRWRR